MKANDDISLLIADGGSTKTDWRLVAPDGSHRSLRTSGLNPAVWGVEKVNDILCRELVPFLLPHILPHQNRVLIYYYGAGCLHAVCRPMERMLERLIPNSRAHVASDLLGAALALFGNREGIVCILGTGSNSCLFDGNKITAHVPPLGYVLGDEGSAAYLGKRLLGDFLKGLTPCDLTALFREQYSLSEEEIIRRVYREPEANRFLASFTPFLLHHRSHPYIHRLLISSFNDFIERNVKSYRARKEILVGFVGGIASLFGEELREAAASFGLNVAEIIAEPIKNLTDYHFKQRNGAESKYKLE